MKVCAKCGKVHEWCRAHRNGTIKAGDPQPCNNRKIPPGSDVCTHHGAYAGRKGKAHNKRKLEEIKQYAAAKDLLNDYGEASGDVNPVEALLWLISCTRGNVIWLRRKVQETNPDQLVWGTTEHVESTEDVKTKEVAAPSVWIKLYNEERDRLTDMLDKAIKNGIEAKRIAFAERMGEQLLGFAGAIFNQLFTALVEQGWVREELEEVWRPVTSQVLVAALEASKETGNGQR